MLGETSQELMCLKRELKAWESMFQRKHARKPNKDDVSNASEEIKETYLRYNQLKRGSHNGMKVDTEAKEKENVEHEVFGKSLNKERSASENKFARVKISPAEYKPIKLCHGQRKPSFSKKLQTKFMESNEDQNSNTIENKKQPVPIAPAIDSNISDDLDFSISSAKQDVSNKPAMLLGKAAVAKRMKRRSALASDWLEKNQLELGGNNFNESGSAPNRSNHVIDNDSTYGFDGEVDVFSGESFENERLTRYKPLKKRSFDNGEKAVDTPGNEPPQTNGIHFGVNNHDKETHLGSMAGRIPNSQRMKSDLKISISDDSKSDSECAQTGNGCNASVYEVSESDCCSSARKHINPQNMDDQRNSVSQSLSDYKTTDLATTENVTPSQNRNHNSTIKRKRTKPVDDLSESERLELSFGSDLELGKTRKRRRTSSKGVNGKIDMGQSEYEDSDGMSDVREESGKEDIEESGKDSQEHSVKKKSFGLVSENFRALNLKVRRYSRRGRGTNYAAYKRKMWKQKQQANEKADGKKAFWKKKSSGESGGNKRVSSSTTTACFKCGEDGHWAKDCPRNKPVAARLPAENWSEPVQAPADLEISDQQWQATEEKLECLVTDRLPRAHNVPNQVPLAIEPLYQPVNDRPIGTPQEVHDALNKLGFDSFRSGQEEAIMQILSGLSTLVVLSTGAGKSLCYQLPAYMYSRREPCITLVISPLVSLMEDQVVGLPFGLHGVSLNTNMSKPQRQKAVDQICSGKAAVVLVSPEALVGGSSAVGCLPHPSKLPPIAFACIDEAHCVSEWSHNFRPSYLRVCKVLRERFGVQCFLGLTATATRSTALSVCEHLGIIHRPDAVVRGATIPDSLNLSVSCDLNRDRGILELLQGSRFSGCDSIIIYCTRREQTDRLATYLRTCLQKNPMNTCSSISDLNEADENKKENKYKKCERKRKTKSAKSKTGKKSWHAECYHAGLSAAQRKNVQRKFMSGELRIVVATVAFGMGLDKADVRAVIHYNMPKSFESYVQEIGRAGRDGLPSHCHVFIDSEGKDVRELRRHAYASTVDRNTIKKLVQQIFPTCDCKTLHANMTTQDNSGETIVNTESSVAGSSKTDVNKERFASDDDLIDHMVEFESQGATELASNGAGFAETGTSEVSPKIDAQSENHDIHETENVLCMRGIARDDFTKCNDVTDGEGVTGRDDVTTNVMSNDEDIGDVINTHYVTNNCESKVASDHHGENRRTRVCGGHEVAIPIEKAVQELDMKEEAIETLLCYLELHAKRWVEILKSIRSTCTLKFYGGPAHLHFVAQRVPIVTAAVRYARRRGEFKRKTSCLAFPIVELVDEMGWDLEPVRRELYGLQWNEALRLPGETGLSAGHSGIIVEFADLAFHIRAPGDLSGDEKDEVCDFLEDRIMAQERSQLGQLHKVWSTFNNMAHPNCWESAEECDKKVDDDLKAVVKEYFESENDATKSELEALSTARKNSQFLQSVIAGAEDSVNWDAVARDMRSFITSHGDLELSGRAIARVFHGIDSPCFPASVWGRERRYWRRYLDVDFNLLRKCATKELVKFR